MSRPENIPVKRWRVAATAPFEVRQELDHLHPVIVQVLYNRHIVARREVDAYLSQQYTKSTDPFHLPDMDKATERIHQAIKNEEQVVVYGDFDADGVTATVLLTEALRSLGMSRRQAQPYIPDRVDEGYGLNGQALKTLRAKGASLVISVDCGIRSFKEVKEAKDLGLDMIITDHHSLGSELPDAVAVINPNRSDSLYPELSLSGVGVAFKLVQALKLALPDQARFDDDQFLDLVALGTVADLVPLRGENRILAAEGLRILNNYERPGVKALADVAGLKPGRITAESISFALAPRINAAGRLSHAYDAAKLLAVNNSIMAKEYANELNQLNRKRQQLTSELGQRAEAMVEPDSPILFAIDSSFVSGIVGLVASRLADKHYRPAIVVEHGSEVSRGSCRSIPEFHITKALDQTESLLVRHGGHAQAAGFTIENENLEIFEQQMLAIAESELKDQDLAPELRIDAEMNVADVDWALQGVLQKLEPTGYGNRPPIFVSRDVHVYSHRTVGKDSSHLQLWVGDGQVKHPCIAFRQGSWAGRLPDRIDLAYSISVNEWNGKRDLQLVIQDIKEVE